jgi:hypothetical protein
MWDKVQAMSTAELRLDVEALTMIAGYAHWIPITQGLHLYFFQENYPGWEWNDIIPVLLKKGVVKINSKEPNQRHLSQGLSIAHDVEGILIKRSKHGSRVTIYTNVND